MKIWIDLDNTPHVPFFVPIIEELERRGHVVVLTARDAFQVCELAAMSGLDCSTIGRHHGKSSARKLFGLFHRAGQLAPFCLSEKPDLALSHGSRAQVLLCNLLRVPTVGITDYEHGKTIPFGWPRWIVVPDALTDTELTTRMPRVKYYNGIKEDVYVPGFSPDATVRERLNLDDACATVLVRPPATEAHYRSAASDVLFEELMTRLTTTEGVQTVLLPRNASQDCLLRETHREWFTDSRAITPPHAVDGLNLIWHSDLVVGGGGTMNREAAALGVPAYSIFRGKPGAVDEGLARSGRLVMIRTPQQIWTDIRLERRARIPRPDTRPRSALSDIVDAVEAIAEAELTRPSA